ncbi:MAG TPA: flagellar filament capping protein FliD [Bryobacteraceae bacterium]|nr:flagellar filament capping protein FliD [Bryobacteraceae bacterium]
MGTTSSTIFTGTSAYSQDFQNVIDRAVAIASLPINQLNDTKTSLTNQGTELTTLESKFSAVQTSVQGIEQALGGSSFEADVSDPSVVSATVGDGAMEGNYSIEVTDVGAYASSMTASSWVDTPGSAKTYTLVIGSNTYNIAGADNSADSVAAAINSVAGDQVRATVVNVGSSDTPDYRISLQATKLGGETLDIQDSGTSLQQQQATGSLAQYIVNGSGQTVSSDSRTVTISNGLTINLLSSSPGNPVNITLTRSTSALSDALSAFVSSYNSAVDELAGQRGQAQGPLEGQSIVFQLSQALSGIATYNSSGGVNSLAALGLDLGVDGKFTFNSLNLLATAFSNSSGITSFLGSSAAGGFLQYATNSLNNVTDPAEGLIASSQDSVQSQITSVTNTIADQQDKVDQLQTQLTNQMSAADALIASMEQQYSYLSNMFQAMQTADEQFK